MNLVELVLLILQLTLFIGARLCDDLTWYVIDYNILLLSIAVGGFILSLIVKVLRMRYISDHLKTFLLAQKAMVIPWFITIVVCYFYYLTFSDSYDAANNTLSLLVILFTTLNYGLICNVALISKV